MSESAFTEAVESALASIDAEDLDTFERRSSEIERRASCLAFVPAPETWARYLVALAAVDYFRGRDWQSPLATALSISPDIDRIVGSEHEIARWEPLPPAPPRGRVPGRAELYVDGIRATHLPAPSGMHLAQIRTEVGFRSALLRDQEVPTEWFGRSEPATVGLVVGAVGGLAVQTQTVDPPGPFASDQDRSVPDAGIGARVWVGRPLAGMLEWTATASRPVDGLAAAGLRLPSGAVGLGLALATADRREGDEVHHSLLAAPAATASGWFGRSLTFDVGASAAVGPSLRYAALRAGATPGGGNVRLRVGLEGRFAAAGFEQPGFDRTLSATDLRLLGQVGAVWGAW